MKKKKKILNLIEEYKKQTNDLKEVTLKNENELLNEEIKKHDAFNNEDIKAWKKAETNLQDRKLQDQYNKTKLEKHIEKPYITKQQYEKLYLELLQETRETIDKLTAETIKKVKDLEKTKKEAEETIKNANELFYALQLDLYKDPYLLKFPEHSRKNASKQWNDNSLIYFINYILDTEFYKNYRG